MANLNERESETETNSAQENSSQLYIPPELRLIMYDNIYPPLRAHLSNCIGIFLSSKDMSKEFEIEAMKKWAAFLGKFRSSFDNQPQWEHLQIDMPPRILKDLSATTVKIPLSICRRCLTMVNLTIPKDLDHAFAPLFETYLEKLRFEFFEDEEDYDGSEKVPSPVHIIRMILTCAGRWSWSRREDEGNNDYRLKQGTYSEADDMMEMSDFLGEKTNVKLVEFYWGKLFENANVDPKEKGLFDHSGLRIRNDTQVLKRKDSGKESSSRWHSVFD